MDITVWMSSPNDVVPAVAEAGATRVVAADFSRRSRRPSVAAWALVTHGLGQGERRQPGWPYAAGHGVSLPRLGRLSGPMWDQTFHAARVRMTVGGRVAVQLAAVALLDLLSCAGPLLGYPRGTHTMFRLLNIFLASSVLGRTARTSHNGEPSAAKSVHRVHREPNRRGRLEFRLPGSR
ncbi:hypothetical protein EVAR_85742_1 [Eumeta japonica]|uniref:Uncharacterized protein n=1 Tax=Eumeta variegata TaxID=151549 RepID=A0A4C1ZI67_EUMVA|nr:hypothetical protein EVAR_85742_1 [Eumeta japonica]